MKSDKNHSRRNFIIGGLAAGGSVVAGQALGAGDAAITNKQPWSNELGDGVDVRCCEAAEAARWPCLAGLPTGFPTLSCHGLRRHTHANAVVA